MEVVHPRCAGIDVSKRDAKVCVRLAGAGRGRASSAVTTWGAVTRQVLALREHLVAEAVTLVVMEATGDYWKPLCATSVPSVCVSAEQRSAPRAASLTLRVPTATGRRIPMCR